MIKKQQTYKNPLFCLNDYNVSGSDLEKENLNMHFVAKDPGSRYVLEYKLTSLKECNCKGAAEITFHALKKLLG